MKKPKEIKTEITITTTPEKAWAILTSFNDYSNWNPFIKSIKGTVEKGKKITVLEPNKEFKLFPGLFDGEWKREHHLYTKGTV